MIQNFLELWYWTIVLVIVTGTVVYLTICHIRDLWETLKACRDDNRRAAPAEKIAEPYSKRMVTVHWLTLALVVMAWYLGDTLADARVERSATMAGYLAHAFVGGAVLMATAMRIVYRSVDKLPPRAGHSLTDVLAKEVQRVLYLLLVLLPLSGFMALLISDVGVALVTVDAKLLPAKYTGVVEIFHEVHDTLMTVLMWVVAVHALGALWHQFILRDGLIKRMSPWR